MKVAVIGSGISGLSAAYLLSQEHEVTLYEKQGRLGGHSVTETVGTEDGQINVDMGFIVYNLRNYPNLSAMFKHLGVKVAKSSMSFGVSAENGKVEYGTESLGSLFAQKSNLLSPSFYSMLYDIARLNSRSKAFLNADPKVTLGEMIDRLGTSEWFRRYYLLAMGGAIWDTAPSNMLDFSAKSFLRFFDNHGLLAVNNHPQWYTVEGGSKNYVDLLEKKLSGKVLIDSEVTNVRRAADKVEVTAKGGDTQVHDAVVFACHSDEVLKAIDSPTAAESEILGAVKYRTNDAILHSDISFMPRRRQAWSSWVFLSEENSGKDPVISVSYWMNNLQPLATKTPMIVTLNPAKKPREDLVHKRRVFEHPLLDASALEAQGRLGEINGKDMLWFCGAWTRHGFHEDGLASAMEVAKKLGCEAPWK